MIGKGHVLHHRQWPARVFFKSFYDLNTWKH